MISERISQMTKDLDGRVLVDWVLRLSTAVFLAAGGYVLNGFSQDLHAVTQVASDNRVSIRELEANSWTVKDAMAAQQQMARSLADLQRSITELERRMPTREEFNTQTELIKDLREQFRKMHATVRGEVAMTDIYKLREHLDAGHPVTGAYSADDATVIGQLYVENIDKLEPISSADLLAWAAQSSDGESPRIGKLKQGQQSANEQIAAICEVALEMIRRDSTHLDLSLPDRSDMVDALVSAGVFSSADKTSLIALATRQVSAVEYYSLGRVRLGTIQQARAL